MRRTFVVGVVLAGSLMLSASAFAAKPSPTEIKLQAEVSALQKQIPALQKQVKTLQTQVKSLNSAVNVLAAVNVCSTAITADALQMTWATVSNVSSIGAIFGTPETAVNDTGACKAANVTRQTTGAPNLTAFKALLSIFASIG